MSSEEQSAQAATDVAAEATEATEARKADTGVHVVPVIGSTAWPPAADVPTPETPAAAETEAAPAAEAAPVADEPLAAAPPETPEPAAPQPPAAEAAAPTPPTPPTPITPTAPPAADVGEQQAALLARIAELEREVAKERDAATMYMQRWQTAQADFANFRRRTQQDQELRDRQIAVETLAPVLRALDSFERAFQTLPESLRSLSWLEGIALIDLQLRRALDQSGIEPIPIEPGQVFDPATQHAVSEAETARYAPGTIVTVLQRGYRYRSGGAIVRPALVQIAKAVATSPSGQNAAPTNGADPGNTSNPGSIPNM